MKKPTCIQNKAMGIRGLLLMMSCLVIFASCKRQGIVPYFEKKGDTYCVYKITEVQNTGTFKALKTGDIFCLYCAGNLNCSLYGNRWLHLYLNGSENIPTGNHLSILTDTNISYYVEPVGLTTCTSCPGQNMFELAN